MEDFEKELRLGFLEEAEQLLNDVEQSYLQLEQNPNESSIIDKIFRVAHNIKGSARAVGFTELGHFAHEFENLLLRLKDKTITPNQAIINLMLNCNDHLQKMISSLKEDMTGVFDNSHLIEQINFALSGGLQSESETNEIDPAVENNIENNFEVDFEKHHSAEQAELSAHPTTETKTLEITEIKKSSEVTGENEISSEIALTADSTQNIPATTIDKVENTSSASNSSSSSSTTETSANQQSSKPNSSPSGNSPQSEESIRVSLNRLEKLLNYVGEMVILQTVLKEQTLNSSLLIRKTVHQLEKATKEVQDISMGLRMLPIKPTFQKMQRIVRDTTSELGKKVKLNLEGEDTELDKTILERISDPLVHLIRNACDHGIESPENRLAAGKSESGTIKLSAYHQSGKLVIEITDDGAGINPDVLRKKAIEKKIVSANTHMSDKEAINLIFHPGFSTKAVVTDLSGRGVGMDVVKNNIEAIQGDIYLDTAVGKGTTFKIILPLTLAIIDAMVILNNDSRYVIPLSHIHESVKLDQIDIKKTTGLGDILLLRGENIPLFYLNNIINKRLTPKNPSDNQIAIVIKNSQETFAVVVDDIIGQYQVVIKKLGEELQGIKGISGSAILGDGKPALILEMSELISKNKKNLPNDLRGVAA